jgi:6-phosphogluconolactonase (cycloisomerase 2 family)
MSRESTRGARSFIGRRGETLRSLSLALTLNLTLLTLLAGACGKSVFPTSSSSSSGGGGSSSTTRSVYVSNFGDGQVSALHRNASGDLTSPVKSSAGPASGAVGLAVTPKLTALYVANLGEQMIHEFTLSSNGNLTKLATIAAGNGAQQPVVDASGAFAYAINSGGSISEYTIDATTAQLTANKPSSTSSGLETPISGVATKSFLYVTDQQSGAGVILTFKINSDGTLASGPSSMPSLGSPGGAAIPNQIIIDPSDTWVFVSDGGAGRVSLFKVAGSGLTFINSFVTAAPGTAEAGLQYVKKGSNVFIYCADEAANSVSVFLFNASAKTLTLTSASPVGALNKPIGLAVDPGHANLYVTNNGGGIVTKFEIAAATGALSNPKDFDTESPINASSAPEFILVTK